MKNDEKYKELIGMTEAAKILHMSPGTLSLKLRRGELKGLTCAFLGNRYRFKRKDVEEYFDNLFKPVNFPIEKERNSVKSEE